MTTEKHRKIARDWLAHLKPGGVCNFGTDAECLTQLLADFERDVRLETLEEAAQYCESRRGLMETGAWRILDAIARELRAEAGKQGSGSSGKDSG